MFETAAVDNNDVPWYENQPIKKFEFFVLDTTIIVAIATTIANNYFE